MRAASHRYLDQCRSPASWVALVDSRLIDSEAAAMKGPELRAEDALWLCPARRPLCLCAEPPGVSRVNSLQPAHSMWQYMAGEENVNLSPWCCALINKPQSWLLVPLYKTVLLICGRTGGAAVSQTLFAFLGHGCPPDNKSYHPSVLQFSKSPLDAKEWGFVHCARCS